MNIKELKEFIKDLPDDMLVYVADSEYGPEETDSIEVTNKQTWNDDGSRKEPIKVLVLG